MSDDNEFDEPVGAYVVIDHTLLQPRVRITKSTADAVIAGLYPVPEDLLARFELVKKIANYADGERDGLRKYIQTHFVTGTYGRMIVQFIPGAVQVYPNADGKFALTNYIQIQAERPREDAPGQVGDAVIILATTFDTAEEFLDEILRLTAKGKEHALQFLMQSFVASGFILDNETLYSKKGSSKINITEIPDAAAVTTS